ncbi:MAG: hypothetical protein LBT47_12415 [Deltaproteobacteria bacterium]|jgi:hypothetical protein|nr:hypothetical protein [Deltaproteobacteria bacterium]
MSCLDKAFIFSSVAPESVEQADLVVGLMGVSGDDNISLGLTKANEGLRQSFPDLSSVIVYCASDSFKKSKSTFLSLPSTVPKILLMSPPGDTNRTHHYINLFHLAKNLNPKAILTIEAHLATVKRSWISRLFEPILKGQAELTAPFYHNLKFDIPVTNLLAYPLFRALFGRRLRQPFHTDRAFSPTLNDIFLSQDWPASRPFSQTELTMNLLAIANGVRICQSFMAYPRYSEPIPPLDPSTKNLFIEVCGSLFNLAEENQELWQKNNRSRPTVVTGTTLTPSVTISRQLAPLSDFLDTIRNLSSENTKFWNEIFSGIKDNLYHRLLTEDLETLTVCPSEWAELIFESILVYHRLKGNDRQHLLESLAPVFLARLITMLRDCTGLTLPQIDAQVEEEARIFETKKSILSSGWS